MAHPDAPPAIAGPAVVAPGVAGLAVVAPPAPRVRWLDAAGRPAVPDLAADVEFISSAGASVAQQRFMAEHGRQPISDPAIQYQPHCFYRELIAQAGGPLDGCSVGFPAMR